LNGFLVVDKPSGLTSHDVVVKVRRLFKEKKVGHCGTLDPMATGVLVLGLGKGTKLSRFLCLDPKVYLGEITLGVTTDTLDATGRVVKECPVEVSEDKIKETLKKFEGEITQIPPMTSAIKVNGVPLYVLARRGIEVERPPRQVRIDKIDFLSWEKPVVKFKVVCGKGTYVRTIAADFGEKLGCGAHLSALRRLSSGEFSIENAWHLQELKDLKEKGKLEEALILLSQGLAHYPQVVVKNKLAYRVKNGNPLTLGMIKERPYPLKNGTYIRLVNEEGDFIALARWSGEEAQVYRQVVAPLEVVIS
jgi:tRNA pseudouridine55 synthase